MLPAIGNGSSLRLNSMEANPRSSFYVIAGGKPANPRVRQNLDFTIVYMLRLGLNIMSDELILAELELVKPAHAGSSVQGGTRISPSFRTRI